MGGTWLAVAAIVLIFWTGLAVPAETKPVRVVATFSILGDLVRQVGGDHVSVLTLVGPDSDVHSFSPAPGDAKLLAQADLIVVNGLGLEGWIDRLVRASGTKATIVTASRGVAPIAEPDPHDHPGHDHGVDPHAWQNVANVKL